MKERIVNAVLWFGIVVFSCMIGRWLPDEEKTANRHPGAPAPPS